MVNRLTRKQAKVANEIDREIDRLYYKLEKVTYDFKRLVWLFTFILIIIVCLITVYIIPFYSIVILAILVFMTVVSFMKNRKKLKTSINRKINVLGKITLKTDIRDTELWSLTRKKILKRDRHTCQDCGDRRKFTDLFFGKLELHIHHKKSVVEGGTNALDNLITLCFSCHQKIHPWLK